MEDILKLRDKEPAKANQLWSEKVTLIKANWSTIQSAGDDGTVAIENELTKMTLNNEKDDFFKLNVGSLLWNMKKLDKAEEIGKIWSMTPITAQYNYVFYDAVAAAQTRDPKALPMLLPLLGDIEGATVIRQHALPVSWPLTLEFIWGSYGTAGLPAALKALKTSSDTNTRINAMLLLARAQYFEALPIIRTIATIGTDKEKSEAIRALGIYGHPDDFSLIEQELNKAQNTNLIKSCLWAFGEGDYTQSVSLVATYLNSEEFEIRKEARTTLHIIRTPDSFWALRLHEKNTPYPKDKELMTVYIKNLEKQGLAGDKYDRLSKEERAEKFKKPASSKPQITHDQWQNIINTATKEKRLPPSWDILQMIESATPEDIPLLVDLRASLYGRLSDEGLEEVRKIDYMILVLGKKRYQNN